MKQNKTHMIMIYYIKPFVQRINMQYLSISDEDSTMQE